MILGGWLGAVESNNIQLAVTISNLSSTDFIALGITMLMITMLTTTTTGLC
jgi:hypothetical protein